MAIWLDPKLPPLATPTLEYLKTHPIRFGRLDMFLSPNQWEFTFAKERFLGWIGGTRSGKSIGAIARELKLSLWIPNNKGIVGRQYLTDLEATEQSDFNDWADRTGMVKSKNTKETVLYCCDYEGRQLPGAPTSVVNFVHFDNPNHLKGRGIGWFHIGEASEMKAAALYRLTDRLSHPAAEGNYSGFLTSNSEGRNWVWNHFYNPETIEALDMKFRLMRRGIVNRTKDNPFLTPEYLESQYATSPPEWIRRYMDAEVDVFEGQIYKEFSYETHCVRSRDCKGWEGHEPPKSWPRTMGIDTGGADPWAFEACAVDPWGNLIFYDEVYRPEAYTGNFERELRDIIDDRNFTAFPMDWENKQAQAELKRMGIRITNAHKREKVKKSFTLAWRYLHPNPKRQFPSWHHRAGEFGSPGVFFTERVKNLVKELPQQRWKKLAGHDIELNEPDDRVSDHAVDAFLYTLREHPKPEATLQTSALAEKAKDLDLKSQLYYLAQKENLERQRKERVITRQPLPPMRIIGEEMPLWM